MRTPAGTECPHYYADFHRGASRQECRLILRNPEGGQWTPQLCEGCAVPRILQANGCPNLMLEARVHKGILGIGTRVAVQARCTLSSQTVDKPEVGCGQCHDLPISLQE